MSIACTNPQFVCDRSCSHCWNEEPWKHTATEASRLDFSITGGRDEGWGGGGGPHSHAAQSPGLEWESRVYHTEPQGAPVPTRSGYIITEPGWQATNRAPGQRSADPGYESAPETQSRGCGFSWSPAIVASSVAALQFSYLVSPLLSN